MPTATRWMMADAGFFNKQLTTSNLQFYISPSSYSGTGSTWAYNQTGTNVTLYNNPSYNSTGGFTFNGTTQYGSFASISGRTDFTASQDYTIEVWCWIAATQLDTGTSDNEILEKWNSSNQSAYPYVLRYFRGSGNIFFGVYNGSVNPAATAPVSTNVWVQLVGVFDHTNNVLNVYKNGVFVSSAAMNISGTISNSSTVEIGRRANAGGASGINYFTGKVGIVRIYNTVLTSSQIQNNFRYDRRNFGL